MKINIKILYISNSRIPTEKAHGIQIMKMCEAFANQGVKLELILPTRKNKQFKDTDPFDYYQVKRNFKIKKIKSLDPYWLIKLPSGIYIKFQALFFMVSLFFYLLFKKNKAEYIFYTRDEYLLPLLQLFSNKVVWESHALPVHFKFYIRSWKNCFKIITLTHCLKNKLVGLNIPAKKILVSPSAVDQHVFDISVSTTQARLELKLPINKILLGYTGTFLTKSMEKGINLVLEALSSLLRERPDLLFVAVGGSPEEIKHYQYQARKLKVEQNALFLGHVKQSKLALYQKAFNILLLPFPNYQHYACFMSPLKLFEYMAAGRPIIASDLPTIREILDSQNAVFFQPGNPQDLAEKIKYLLKHEDLRKKIALCAQQQVKQYTWQKRSAKIINFFKYNINNK